MKKYLPIIKDGFILMIFSSIFAVICIYAVNLLKGSGVKTDPIIAAIIQDDIEQMKKDIAQSSERVNSVDEQGRTPLMWAAYVNFKSTEKVVQNEGKRLEASQLLFEKGADVNAKDKDGWTALTWAAWTGFDKVSALLIEKGAELNVADKKGQTPLMVAALRGNVGVVKLLIEKGANKTLSSADGKTAAQFAETAMTQYPDRKKQYEEILPLVK